MRDLVALGRLALPTRSDVMPRCPLTSDSEQSSSTFAISKFGALVHQYEQQSIEHASMEEPMPQPHGAPSNLQCNGVG